MLNEDLSERGFLLRLERVCANKKKKGGVCQELHDYYTKADKTARMGMCRTLAACEWDSAPWLVL